MTAMHGEEHPLTGSLMEDHEVILRALERLEERMREWRASGRVDPEPLRRFISFARTFIDRCHHGKEERCLFPCLERRGIPREGGPIGVMLYEHQVGRELVARLEGLLRALESGDRGAAAGVLATCEEYVNLLRDHIRKENLVLFPMGESVARAGDAAEVGRCYENVEEVEVGHGVHERFRRVADEI
ncbi:MAG: hemerythrin domain-containing protein [Nitrososphaerota archaeon]